MFRSGRRTGRFFIVGSALMGLTAGPTCFGGGEDFEGVLARLRPDYATYIGSIRPGPSRFHPANLYMGLVRPAGRDPSLISDAPLVGRGVKNDVIVYADSRESGRSFGWGMLLIDHEYFHARHLARGDQTPTPSFGDLDADRHFYEAVAWGYNLAQADEDAYPSLTHADYREALRNYTFHYEAFRDYVLRHDRYAWAHYGRFLPGPSTFDRMLLARN